MPQISQIALTALGIIALFMLSLVFAIGLHAVFGKYEWPEAEEEEWSI